MNNFPKGKKVVKLLVIANLESASIQTVGKVTKTYIQLEGEDFLRYDKITGREINPTIAGCWSRLVRLEE